MKIKMSLLRKLIRDTINEISTPGVDQYDAYSPGRGDNPGVGRAYRKASFRGFDDSTPTNYKDLDGNIHSSREDMDYANHRIRKKRNKNQQGLGSPGSSYSSSNNQVPQKRKYEWNGLRWVDVDQPGTVRSGEQPELDKDGGGRMAREFLIVIDSPVTRGRGGKVTNPNSNTALTVKEEKGSGTLAGDLYNNFQMKTFMTKKSRENAMDIAQILESYEIITDLDVEFPIDVDKIGIRTPSNVIYGIEDYLAAYKNRFITESKKRVRLKKSKRKNIL